MLSRILCDIILFTSLILYYFLIKRMSESIVDRCLKCVCLCCCYYRPAREWIAADCAADAKFLSRPARNKANTYGLERLEKNAMLILAQTEPQGAAFVEQRVEMLTRSFGGFGFEVETYVDLDPEQMEARLEDFFRRDFSRVGAVGVAVVGGAGEAGQLQARAQRCHESRVLRHLTNELPSALAGRPRIYITEMARSGAATDSGAYSLPITVLFPDVIAVHIPVIIEGESNPLQMLCDRLGSERDFRAEVMAAAHVAETAFPALAARSIQVDSTLTLDLELVRTASVPDGVNVTPENVPDGDKRISVNLTDGVNEPTERVILY